MELSKWLTPLTSEQFPSIQRGHYSRLTKRDAEVLSNIVEGNACTSGKDLADANIDWLQIYRGSSPLLLKPRSTAEVSRILKYCHERNLAVVPQGGNTSLAGGSVPVFDEVVINLKLMDKIISFNNLSGALFCEAGCTLQALLDHLEARGHTMPYRIGPKDTCQIGGNMSTNCGGMHVVRYGTRQSSILGLEVVLGDGSVLDLVTTMKKDNTGYHLKHLFLGAEGTLGIITKVAIECPIKSPSQHMVLLGIPSFDKILEIYKRSKYELGGITSAFEVISETCMQLLNKNLGMPNPLNRDSAFYMIIATAGASTRHDTEKLDGFLAGVRSEGLISDALRESCPEKMQVLWSYREKIAVALRAEGVCYKYDITVPHERFFDISTELRRLLQPNPPCIAIYGHFAEGDVHLNLILPALDPDVQERAEEFMFAWIKRQRGSISSEHGLGIQRRDKIHFSKSPKAIEVMRRVKMTFDPRGILNPYKVLPAPDSREANQSVKSQL